MASETDLDVILNALRHPMRRQLIAYLSRNPESKFTEMLQELRITDKGRLGYYLRFLESSKLIEQPLDGKGYILTELGRKANGLVEAGANIYEATSPTLRHHIRDLKMSNIVLLTTVFVLLVSLVLKSPLASVQSLFLAALVVAVFGRHFYGRRKLTFISIGLAALLLTSFLLPPLANVYAAGSVRIDRVTFPEALAGLTLTAISDSTHGLAYRLFAFEHGMPSLIGLRLQVFTDAKLFLSEVDYAAPDGYTASFVAKGDSMAYVATITPGPLTVVANATAESRFIQAISLYDKLGIQRLYTEAIARYYSQTGRPPQITGITITVSFAWASQSLVLLRIFGQSETITGATPLIFEARFDENAQLTVLNVAKT